MKRILVCGAAGFLGTHLIKRLKQDGHWVRGLDRRMPAYGKSPADEFWTKDLREQDDTLFEGFNEVYQLAAEVGGVAFTSDRSNDAVVLANNTQINLNVLASCDRMIPDARIFFPSSCTVYGDLPSHHCSEHWAYPARPTSEYGWEKLYAERLYNAYGLEVRIARIHNAFGPFAPYQPKRESVIPALIRKCLEAPNGTSIEVWGDGSQTRSFMYVDDCIDGMIRLMASDYCEPVNLGSPRSIAIRDLAPMIATICGKILDIKYVVGPTGVQHQCSDNTLLKEVLGWEPVFPLELGIVHTTRWIATQLRLFNPAGDPAVPALDTPAGVV